jgi:HlyD family secretion protein
MIVNNNRARQVAVDVGVREDDRIQITRGLAGSETVIVSGAYGLPDNTQVKIASAQPAGEAPEGKQ